MKTVLKQKILIVEDQLIIAADIQLQLIELGYQVVGIHQNIEGVLLSIQKHSPDLILIDIGTGDNDNTLKLARYISSKSQTPLLYLSYSTDLATFKKILDTNPYGLIPKPFQRTDLERGIQNALHRIAYEKA